MDDISFAFLLGCALGFIIVGFLYAFIISTRRLQLKTYMREIPSEDAKLVWAELLSVEHSLKSLSDKTNLSLIKSWYNSLQDLLSFINKRKLP